jgi:hypothetical protein
MERLRVPVAALTAPELAEARADERVMFVLLLAGCRIGDSARWTVGTLARDDNAEPCSPWITSGAARRWSANGAVVAEHATATRRDQHEDAQRVLDLALWVADQVARKHRFADLMSANDLPHPEGPRAQHLRVLAILRAAQLAAKPPVGAAKYVERRVIYLMAESVAS